MKWSDEQLNDVFDSTTGKCHICHKKLAWKNYATVGRRGAWEVDHAVPRKRGGTDRKSNLKPACISCNRSKQEVSTKVARYANGVTRAPLSAERRKQAKLKNGLIVGGMVTAASAAVVGPFAILGGLIAGVAAHNQDPDRF